MNMCRVGVVAAIAAVGDDASEVGADLRLDLRDDGGERMAVIELPGSALAWAMKLAAPGAMEGCGERDLDATWAFLVKLVSTWHSRLLAFQIRG